MQYSPSSGYDSNQLVRYDDLYKQSTPPTPSYTYVDVTISWGFTITNSCRMYGSPAYLYNGTVTNLFESSDFPVSHYQTNRLLLPAGCSFPFDITQAMWLGAQNMSGFVVQGSSVNAQSFRQYITFTSGANGGWVRYVKTGTYNPGDTSCMYMMDTASSTPFRVTSSSMTVTIA